jgi:hypothetical protein
MAAGRKIVAFRIDGVADQRALRGLIERLRPFVNEQWIVVVDVRRLLWTDRVAASEFLARLREFDREADIRLVGEGNSERAALHQVVQPVDLRVFASVRQALGYGAGASRS